MKILEKLKSDRSGLITKLCENITSLEKIAFEQQTEIERLKEENKKQKMILEEINNEINPLPFVTDFDVAIKRAKSEAYKEFAERLKAKYVDYDNNVGAVGKIALYKDIDNLLKELTEGGNEPPKNDFKEEYYTINERKDIYKERFDRNVETPCRKTIQHSINKNDAVYK